MGGRGRMVAALLAALLVGGAVGGYAGFRLGTDAVVSLWVTTNAGHTEDVVAILEHMRGERQGEALAGLETHLNRHVFGLMPASREGAAIRDTARERAAVATRRARAYREQHPHGGRTALDRDVRQYLGGG